MTIAEKLLKVAENEQKVYDAGKTAGKRDFLAIRDGAYLFYENGITDDKLANIFSDPNITADVTSMNRMFYNCKALTTIPKLNTSRVTDMDYAFQNCKALISVPELDTSNVTNMNGMFHGCSVLTSVPLFDTSNVTSTGAMFSGCSVLTSVPLFDTSNVTNMNGMFQNCTALISVPEFDTRSVTSMSTMFENCKALTTIPKLNSSRVTGMYRTFYACQVLTTIPELDMRVVTSLSSMFYNNKKLTDVHIKNISKSLQIGSGTSWGHLLTVESLVGLCYELRDTGSVLTLTIGSGNLTKLASVYVRRIEITDEMRAADDLIDEKLPFEVCESTDEGATLISEYVTFKNWKLA